MEKALTRFEKIKIDPYAIACIEQADLYIGAIGYTEHGIRHAVLCANIAGNILERLGFEHNIIELAAIASFLHDIGNVISRESHMGAGALLAKDVMNRYDFEPAETAMVMNAIGNHEEGSGWPTHPVSAALILADKSDVHRTRVRSTDQILQDQILHDIHDRVNYAAKRSFLRVDSEDRTITLEIEIDTSISQVLEYFEIFLSRMVMCRRAAEFLNATFHLLINNTKLL